MNRFLLSILVLGSVLASADSRGASQTFLQEIKQDIALPFDPGQSKPLRLFAKDATVLVIAEKSVWVHNSGQWQGLFQPPDGVVITAAAMAETGKVYLGGIGQFWVIGKKISPVSLPARAKTDTVLSLYPAQNGSLWVGTQQGLWQQTGKEWQSVSLSTTMRVQAFCQDSEGRLWAATNHGLWCTWDGRWIDLSHSVLTPGLGEDFRFLTLIPPSTLTAIARGTSDQPATHQAPPFAAAPAIAFASSQAVGVTNWRGFSQVYTGAEGLPYTDAMVIKPIDNGFWVGTKRGCARFSNGHWDYYAGKRWLADDLVLDILPLDAHTVWIATSKGISEIKQSPITFAEKAKVFEQRVHARHDRHGQVTGCNLRVPGDLSTSYTRSDDNDGLWTAIYLASQCFRFAVTKERDAYENAIRAYEAMERLESITGISGFPARSFAKIDEDVGRGGEWHPTADGQWKWKGDTSSDELVGHMFAYPIFYDLVADASYKERVRSLVHRIMTHIVEHQFLLVDLDGRPTRWGVWNPDSLNNNPNWLYERGLNSLQILSFLRAAYHVTGEAKFIMAYRDLIAKHHYAENMRFQKMTPPFEVNHSDDELAFLPYYILFRYADEPDLLPIYRQSMEHAWQVEIPEKNPLWNFIATFALHRDCGIADAIESLQLIPMDLITWRVENSQRADVRINPLSGRFQEAQSLVPLPIDERGINKWNHNPYRLDEGGDGHSEDDGSYWLCPYWMGRYHGYIEE